MRQRLSRLMVPHRNFVASGVHIDAEAASNAADDTSQIPWEPNPDVLRIVTIADTHSSRPPIPPGDIFIHAGDLTGRGTANQLRAVLSWISSLPHPIKLVVAGNHDACLCKPFLEQMDGNADAAADIDWNAAGIIYLEHSSSEIQVRGRTLKVFGSPYTPAYGNWAFQYPSSYRPAPKWDEIPHDTGILITHGPVRGLLDQGYFGPSGCSQLKTRIEQVRPFLHVFGHIHEARGHMNITWDSGVCSAPAIPQKQPLHLFPRRLRPPQNGYTDTMFVNAAIVAQVFDVNMKE